MIYVSYPEEVHEIFLRLYALVYNKYDDLGFNLFLLDEIEVLSDSFGASFLKFDMGILYNSYLLQKKGSSI